MALPGRFRGHRAVMIVSMGLNDPPCHPLDILPKVLKY